VDSTKTIELGINQPISQALFFARVYSENGNITYFYTMNKEGNISKISVPIEKDENGGIKSITINGVKYDFIFDKNGDVTSYNMD
jgi:hypothetical protein